MRWRWTSGVGGQNGKTGPIPTALPADKNDAWQSCNGCPLRALGRGIPGKQGFAVDRNKPVCYAWGGRGHAMFPILDKAEQRLPGRYTLEYALAHRLASARAVRMSGLGDPSTTPPGEYCAMMATVRRAGLAWLDYTHFWRTRGQWLKGMALASCDTWQSARAAVRKGWRAAVHVPTLPKKVAGMYYGVKYRVCPNVVDKSVTCNVCRLCDASKATAPQVIVFLNH